MFHSRQVVSCLAVFLLCGFVLVVHGQDKGSTNKSVRSEDDLDELIKRHNDRRLAFHKEIATASTKEEQARVSEDFMAYWLSAINDVVAIAKRQPSSGVGKRAAIWVVTFCDADYTANVEAAEILLEHHPRSAELEVAYSKLTGFHPVYEKLLRAAADSNVTETAKAYAMFALADLLVSRSSLKDRMDTSPELRPELIKEMGKHIVEYVETTERRHDRAEAIRLYKRVKRESGDLTYRDLTLRDAATERLLPLEQTYPEIGKVAPNINGRDLQGNALALEDHRGKVVVISFWASWCGPCLSLVPAENKLIEHFKTKPFALMGVNGDDSVDSAIQAADEHDVHFRSWWDDPANHMTIVERYHVTSWPTVFVVDQNGVIRNKNLFGSDLQDAVDHLLSAGATATDNRGRPNVTAPTSSGDVAPPPR
ncbi:MAG: TlpA family protein disulfide reductase [Planctomycetales bacterium]|nr:TlpA family protein disulfide reductase [Planctomycetales bacterium]